MPIKITLEIGEGEDGFVYTNMSAPASPATDKEVSYGKKVCLLLEEQADLLAKEQGINVKKRKRPN